MDAAANSNGAKKQKLDEASNAKTKSPSAYGLQEYWEERYKKNHSMEENQQNENESDSLPYHPWYFTYEELSPLILPIILGGRDVGVDVLGGRRKDIAEENEDAGGDENPGKDNENSNQSNENSNGGKESDQSDTECVEEEKDEMEKREELARNGPISVIEIGCGDMPLGRELSMELSYLQTTTGAKANQVVKEIVCCDFSPAVIDLCKENQRQDIKALGNSGSDNFVAVDYITADARKLPYPDCSFDLILEKGTLDAMLSDKENGQSSCILIMADCARVLKEHGYIILVSHINAHTENGIDWLNTVVVAGLRNGGCNSRWEIEVHGSDGTAPDECYGQEESESEHEIELECGDGSEVLRDELEGTEPTATTVAEDGSADGQNAPENAGDEQNTHQMSIGPPSGGPGPAVYIIHNLSKPTDTYLKDDDPPTVPLKFFSY